MMKKELLMLVLLIVVLTAVINLSSCKKKDSDPTPKGTVVTGCAKTMFSIQYTTNWSMQFEDVRYRSKFKDTLITNSYGSTLIMQPNSNGCENNGTKMHFTFWNSDSTVVRDFDWFCPPNDTVYYVLQ